MRCGSASDLLRRAEAGETITVTVNGPEVAQLGPVLRDRWRRWNDVADILAGPDDPAPTAPASGVARALEVWRLACSG